MHEIHHEMSSLLVVVKSHLIVPIIALVHSLYCSIRVCMRACMYHVIHYVHD